MSLEKHTQCSENLITFPQIAMIQTLETLNILLVIRVYYKIVCGLPQVALEVNNPPANTGTIRGRVQSLGWEDPGGGYSMGMILLFPLIEMLALSSIPIFLRGIFKSGY